MDMDPRSFLALLLQLPRLTLTSNIKSCDSAVRSASIAFYDSRHHPSCPRSELTAVRLVVLAVFLPRY
jgi:hypothetical protein